MKRYDLMHQINTRGTFLVSKMCIPHLKLAQNPHILNLAPPLDMKAKWFKGHVAYTMAKFGMSMCTLGMSAEFAKDGIAVNSLWPLTAIDTAAVRNLLGGDGGGVDEPLAGDPGRRGLRDLQPAVARDDRQFLHRRRGAARRRRRPTFRSMRRAPRARWPAISSCRTRCSSGPRRRCRGCSGRRRAPSV